MYQFVWMAVVMGWALPAFGQIAIDALSDPIPVLVDGQPLDVEREGSAAPCVFDYDHDDKPDLLVGERFGGRLRIYRNVGSRDQPKFSAFTLFQDGLPEGCVPVYNVFCPQVADLDGDGQPDIITPVGWGGVQWFRQNKPGDFSAGKPIQTIDGYPLRLQGASGVATVDWDADGDLDLVVGSADGRTGFVHLLINASQGGKLQFNDPVKLTTDQGDMTVLSGHAAPAIADWDGDGLFDVLIGAADGSVVWHRNTGESGKPQFTAPQPLVAPSNGEAGPGKNAIVCVTDWNADGRLDLLVGDLGEEFQKQLNEGEIAQRKKAAADQVKALAEWGRFYRLYRQLRQPPAREGQVRLAHSARTELIRRNRKQTQHYLEMQALFEGPQHHGRVWVFLRQ